MTEIQFSNTTRYEISCYSCNINKQIGFLNLDREGCLLFYVQILRFIDTNGSFVQFWRNQRNDTGNASLFLCCF